MPLISILHPHTFHELILIIDNCSNGDMRLIDGLTEAEGRVEICTYGRWATVSVWKVLDREEHSSSL